MSISSVNGDLRENCTIWRFDDGEFFPVGMEEKVSPKEVWGWGRYFTPRPAENPSTKALLK
jgi:hypothetical protein